MFTIFQIVELQSPSLNAHLTVGVNGGSSMGSTLSHDEEDMSLLLPGEATSLSNTSSLIFSSVVVCPEQCLTLQLLSSWQLHLNLKKECTFYMSSQGHYPCKQFNLQYVQFLLTFTISNTGILSFSVIFKLFTQYQ